MNHNINAGKSIQSAFIVQAASKTSKIMHTNANNGLVRRASQVHVNQAVGSASMLYQAFKQILVFKNAAKIKQNTIEANRIQCMEFKHIFDIICQVQLSLNRASPGLAENQNAVVIVKHTGKVQYLK